MGDPKLQELKMLDFPFCFVIGTHKDKIKEQKMGDPRKQELKILVFFFLGHWDTEK